MASTPTICQIPPVNPLWHCVNPLWLSVAFWHSMINIIITKANVLVLNWPQNIHCGNGNLRLVLFVEIETNLSTLISGRWRAKNCPYVMNIT